MQDKPHPLQDALYDAALVRGLQWLSNAEEKQPRKETATESEDENEKARLRVWMRVLIG